jgi:hypothetical protein
VPLENQPQSTPHKGHNKQFFSENWGKKIIVSSVILLYDETKLIIRVWVRNYHQSLVARPLPVSRACRAVGFKSLAANCRVCNSAMQAALELRILARAGPARLSKLKVRLCVCVCEGVGVGVEAGGRGGGEGDREIVVVSAVFSDGPLTALPAASL